MSRYWDDGDTMQERIYRGLLVAEYHDDVGVFEYIQQSKRSRD